MNSRRNITVAFTGHRTYCGEANSDLRQTILKLCEEGKPYHTHLVCPIASAYAVEYLQMHLPEDGVTLWVAAIDEELTSRSYIVPGLGDAGDLAFGVKK